MRKFFQLKSLRARLILLLSMISFIVWAVSAAFQWRQVSQEIHRLFDANQILFAERLASSNILGGFHRSLPMPRKHQRKHIEDNALAFAVFTERGDLIFNDGRNGKNFTFEPVRGFTEKKITESDGEREKWRLFWLKQRDVFIVVGQELEYRQSLISKLIFSQFFGWLLGLPVLICAIWFAVRYEFRSVNKLEQELRNRKPDETEKLSTLQLPSEIEPLVNTLNHYFDRTQQMFERERRFTSDAAHELRSPLAGIRLQSELAQMSLDDKNALEQCLQNMTGGIDRISLLIEQLLTFSRLDNMQQLDDAEPIDWQNLLQNAVAQVRAFAEQKQSEILLDLQALPQGVQGKPMLLALVLRNLLDNALHYTPEGSQISVTLNTHFLTVEDNGKGVSSEDLIRLGQPFFRPVNRPVESSYDEKGSGLGLSIIKRIAMLHGFDLQFSQSEKGGLKVSIGF